MGKKLAAKDAQTLRWKPRMKNAAQRTRTLSSSGSAGVADTALSGMSTINKLRGQGHEVDVAKLAGRSRPPAAVASHTKTRRPASHGSSPARRRMMMATGMVAAAVGATAFVYCSGAFAARHTIAGKVWLERRLLDEAELRFHPADAGDTPATVVAVQHGKFRITGVTPGRYRVTVHPPAGPSAALVATNFTTPESTPLHVNVNGDILSMQLDAYTAAPKPRQPTRKPRGS